MKVSMDGLRQSLASDVGRLKREVECVLDSSCYDYNQDLINAMNKVISGSNILLCVYDDDNEGDMSDLSGSDYPVTYIDEDEY